MQIIRSVRSALLTSLAALPVLLSAAAEAQPNDADRFVDAAKALELFTTDEEHGIPADILQRARGIAVIPKLIRGGLVFGGRRGPALSRRAANRRRAARHAFHGRAARRLGAAERRRSGDVSFGVSRAL
jgi:lipid-binding SYLF domain-containing protein